MTQETKREIAELYADKSNKAHDIAAAYKISPAHLTKIVLEMGGELRRPKATKSAKAGFKKCPKCKRFIEIKGARFCPFCAADVRSEKDILIERATWLWQVVQVIGTNDRDKARNTISDIINYLNKEG